jgi:ABC-2 type transport system permease protein
VNWQHFRTLVWLRRRLFKNRMRRAGKVNAVVTQILMVLAGVASVALFFAALGLGVWLLPKASADHVLYLWTAISVAFLFFWMLGVMTELQRSEVLSIEKLFHFPISPSSAFVINYLSSLVCLSLILFFPAMIGLAVASVVALGPWMLISLPLVLAFVLMVTSITYQFRGWLATLMVNKRRARTIVAFMTGTFILAANLPNLIRFSNMGNHRPAQEKVEKAVQTDQAMNEERREIDRLQADLNAKKITPQESQRRLAVITEMQQKNAESLNETRREKDRQESEAAEKQAKYWIVIADLALPPGWLAYGTHRSAEGQILPGIAGSVLLCVIAGASLRRSYRTTVRFYLGANRSTHSGSEVVRAQPGAAPVRATDPVASPGSSATASGTYPPLPRLLARNLPGVPEQAAATALATLRALVRAPEVKMMLLTPILLGGVFFTTRLANRGGAPIAMELRTVIALGAVVTVTVSLSQLFQNLFGFDRSAFRMFVLSPASRREILLGKNLALAPIVLGAALIFLGILEFMFPLRPTELLATLVELLSAFLIVCLVGNQMSILLPSAVRQGSMRNSDTKVLRVLARFVAMLGLMVAFVPLAIPPGLDYLAQTFFLQQYAWGKWIPVYLILSLLLALVTLLVYRTVLDYQGGLLQRRELRVLEAVTTKDD